MTLGVSGAVSWPLFTEAGNPHLSGSTVMPCLVSPLERANGILRLRDLPLRIRVCGHIQRLSCEKDVELWWQPRAAGWIPCTPP